MSGAFDRGDERVGRQIALIEQDRETAIGEFARVEHLIAAGIARGQRHVYDAFAERGDFAADARAAAGDVDVGGGELMFD